MALSLPNLVKTLWKLEEDAEKLRKIFDRRSKSCEFRIKDAEYDYDNCSHPRNVCRACNHCNCGFADNPLEVM